jgi:hypothetical protein
MVVIVESGFAQGFGLIRAQHAERGAGFHAEIVYAADHFSDLSDLAGFGVAIGSAHAKAGGAPVAFRSCGADYLLDWRERRGGEAGAVMHALRAIAAVFGAAAGLDAHQCADLDLGRIEVLPMHRMCAKQKLMKGQLKQFGDFGDAPVVTDSRRR